MIEFANEHIRSYFHGLPADVQAGWENMAARFATTGQVITILAIEKFGEGDRQLEIAIRIGKEFNSICPVEGK